MTQRIVPTDQHDAIVTAAFRKRGFTAEESAQAAWLCAAASRHGIKTHNAIKALHLDDLFGSRADPPGCVPGAKINILPSRYPAALKWDAQRKLGPSVAFAAVDVAERLADQYGVGIVSVDNAFHYLWGGGYVMESAKRGYIAYTHCTASLAEVVPFGGRFPTLGTNPHSWAFPTTDALGFPIVIDWATSTIATGRVQQYAREGKPLPPGAAVDKNGQPTTDPSAVAALLPFGEHKGYGLGLINELIAAMIGGSLPTIRSRPPQPDAPNEKHACNFFFQVIHPDALNCGAFAAGRDQAANLKAVIDDILAHGNADAGCILPGQLEHQAARRTDAAGGLLFTDTEIAQFKRIADDAAVPFDPATLQTI